MLLQENVSKMKKRSTQPITASVQTSNSHEKVVFSIIEASFQFFV